ncbi:MAG: glycine cleavage system protein GcvH [Candidatus Diapherotrites archaeon]
MDNPKDLMYTKQHEWIKVEDGTGTVGITHFAQQMLTDIVFVELPQKGKTVEQFSQLCVLESVKSVSDVFAPVSGEVIEVNTVLSDAPEKINSSAFEEGWIAKIKLKDAKELDNLMTAEQYTEYLKTAKH